MSNAGMVAVQVASEADKVPVYDIVQHWQSADRLAAGNRLNLARHYQEQYDRLDLEFTNLRISQVWLANQGGEAEAALLLAYVETLAPYLRQRGLNAELLRWCKDGLSACRRLEQNPARLLLLRSEAQNLLGRWTDTVASIQAAIGASQESDPPTHAQAVLALGRLWFNQGDYDKALKTLAEAETLLEAQADYTGVATVRSEFAAYYLNRGELDQALSLYLEVDRLRKQAGATETSDQILMMLGVVYRKKREYDRATAYLQQLLTRAQARGNKGAEATAAHHLAWVYLNKGNASEARRFCGQAMTLYDEIGDLRGASDAFEQLGLVALAGGENEEALFHLKRSLSVRQELSNQHGAASSLRHLALAYLRMGHLGAAVSYLWQSLWAYHRLRMLSRQRWLAILHEFWDWTIGYRRWTV
ncbi:MAG: DUF2225 domain-containing protein [Anaerolineae bacterium]|nr:DUF2225 domain-containing protein [Anaerolineae bacterium]